MGAIESAISVLHEVFRYLNRDLFNNELSEPALLIQHQGKKCNSLGWCSSSEIWSNSDGSIKLHEITICAEYLDRGVLDICETLLHEMVHLYCSVNGIKDTSRGTTYHNKKYRQYAEKYGLNCEHDNKHGWSNTGLKDETKKLIESYKFNQDVFKIARMIFDSGNSNGTSGVKRSSMKKFSCDCEIVIRCKQDINVICEDCGEKFEEVE